MFENPEFEISQKYAFVLNTMFLTAFYTPLIPLALIYALIGIFLIYWVDKYTLLRRRTVKSALGVKLSLEMTDLLEWFLPIFCFSNILFEYIVIPPNKNES